MVLGTYMYVCSKKFSIEVEEVRREKGQQQPFNLHVEYEYITLEKKI